MAPAFRLNRAVPPGVCVSLFTLTSVACPAGMHPNGLLFDICTDNWPAFWHHTHEDSSLEDLSSEHSMGTCNWHSLTYRIHAKHHGIKLRTAWMCKFQFPSREERRRPSGMSSTYVYV